MKNVVPLVLMAALLLSVCGAVAPAQPATPTPAPTATNTHPPPTATSTPLPPTATLQPPTDTPLPPTATFTATPQPTAVTTEAGSPPVTDEPDVDLPDPVDPPLKVWKGIPIMPQAIAGLDENDSYTYTVDATPEEVQAFYDREMPRLGYSPLGVGSNDQGETVALLYTKGGGTVMMSLLTSASGKTLILIVAT